MVKFLLNLPKSTIFLPNFRCVFVVFVVFVLTGSAGPVSPALPADRHCRLTLSGTAAATCNHFRLAPLVPLAAQQHARPPASLHHAAHHHRPSHH